MNGRVDQDVAVLALADSDVFIETLLIVLGRDTMSDFIDNNMVLLLLVHQHGIVAEPLSQVVNIGGLPVLEQNFNVLLDLVVLA